MADTSQDRIHPSGWTVDTLREHFTQVLLERDACYKVEFAFLRQVSEERLKGLKQQLSDAEALRQADLRAQKEAITKAENAQQVYNQGHNDLSRKMEQQYQQMVPLSEARLKWASTDKDISENRAEVTALRESFPKEITGLRIELMNQIASLRESRSEGGGRQQAERDGREQHNWSVGIIMGLIFGLIGFLFSVANFAVRWAGK